MIDWPSISTTTSVEYLSEPDLITLPLIETRPCLNSFETSFLDPTPLLLIILSSRCCLISFDHTLVELRRISLVKIEQDPLLNDWTDFWSSMNMMQIAALICMRTGLHITSWRLVWYFNIELSCTFWFRSLSHRRILKLCTDQDTLLRNCFARLFNRYRIDSMLSMMTAAECWVRHIDEITGYFQLFEVRGVS